MKKPPKTLTIGESGALIEWLTTDRGYDQRPKVRFRNVTIALLMLDAGLRVNETRQLLINDLWFRDAPVTTLTVPTAIAKNHKAREIPLTVRILESLWSMDRAWWAKLGFSPKLYAFYGYNSARAITTRQIENIIRYAGDMALNKRVTPHMLRHTFATRLMRKTNSRVVQELLGHSVLTSTQIYLHPNAEDRKLAIDSMQNEVS